MTVTPETIMTIKINLITLLAAFFLMCGQSATIAQVRILSPNGGEVFDQLDCIPILWTSTDTNATSRVEFSTDGGKNWEIIFDSVKQNKACLPKAQINSTHCLVRVRLNIKPVFNPVLEHVLPISSGYVTSATFSPDDRLLSTTSWDHKVRIWDVKSGKLIRTLNGHTNNALHTEFSPDGTELLSTSLDNSLRFWNTETGIQKDSIKNGLIWVATYSPDNIHIATGNDSGAVRILNRRTLAVESEILSAHTEAIRSLLYFNDGKGLIACSTDRSATIIDVADAIPVIMLDHHSSPKEEEPLQHNIVNSIKMIPSQSIVVTGGYNGLVKYWNSKSGELISTHQYHNGAYVSHLEVSSDERWLFSSGYDGITQIIDTRTKEPVAEIRSDTGWAVQAKLNRAGNRLALAHWKRALIYRLELLTEDTSDKEWTIYDSRAIPGRAKQESP